MGKALGTRESMDEPQVTREKVFSYARLTTLQRLARKDASGRNGKKQ